MFSLNKNKRPLKTGTRGTSGSNGNMANCNASNHYHQNNYGFEPNSMPAKTTTTIITSNGDPVQQPSSQNGDSNIFNEMNDNSITHRSWALIHSPLMIIVRKIRINDNYQSDLQAEYDETVQSIKMYLAQLKCLLDSYKINFTYDIPEGFFYDDYVLKFHINILAQDPKTRINHKANANLLVMGILDFCKNSCQNQNNLILEFPYNTLNRMYEEVAESSCRNDFLSPLDSLSMGSILNLNTFVTRLVLFSSKIEINFLRTQITFYFSLSRIMYRMDIKFQSIKYMVLELGKDENKNRTMTNTVYMELNCAPFLFVKSGRMRSDKKNSKRNDYERVKDFSKIEEQNFATSRKNPNQTYANGNNKPIDPDIIGYCLGYQFQLPKKFNIGALINLGFICKESNNNFSFYIGKLNDIKIKTLTIVEVIEKIDTYFLNNYNINYAFRVLFSKSYKAVDLLMAKDHLEKFFKHIESLLEQNENLVEQCILSLDTLFKNRIIDFMIEFERLFEEKSKLAVACAKKQLNQDDHVIMRRALVTPTKTEFTRPIVLLRSRFSNIANLDYSLRLMLSEDNNGTLNYSKNQSEFVKQSIKPRLLGGIKVGNRLFQFLGSSSSQMRENGIVFYARDDQGRTAKSIHNLVGNLSDFKRKVAKYIARFGLVFSQAIAYYEFDDSVQIYKAEDMKTDGEKGFNFSDGIGIISERIAVKIVPLLRVPKGYSPSAFQIRHGGCKGMLVRYETDGEFIIFRTSMIKYDSKDNSLGILKFSAPRPVFLNRPLIMILDQQGVPPEVFYRFFTESTQMIASALIFDDAAFRLIRIYRNNNLPYEKFNQAGMSFLREPMLRRILNHLAFYRLNELKAKARIRLPFENGRCAFGVIDERKTLNSGEIFFQYSVLNSDGHPTDETVILEGEVMVTKFPCLSLGDVRKFRAVKTPSLQHIKDCLVFPAKGNRPHTDEMGGSDLDGDEYAIFWQTDLIFSRPNARPMDFPSQDPGELSHDIKLEDIVDFYCDFLLENNIGQVANCHLMHADFHPNGLRSEECEKLAVKYSISLDFQKSGVNSQLEDTYICNRKWIKPDFMARKSNHSLFYLSPRMLGQFYRHCCLIEAVIQMSDLHLLADEQNAVRKPKPNFILDGWRRFEEKANEAFMEYNHLVIEAIDSMEIGSEVAFLSDVFEDREESSTLQIDKVFAHFQAKFEEQAKGLNDYERLLLISAWYAICFEKSDLMQYHYQDQPLLGLPFMVPDMVIQLAQTMGQQKRDEKPGILSEEQKERLHKLIQEEKLNRYAGIAENLILSWMKNVNKYVFERENFLQIVQYRESANSPWKTESEEVLLTKLVKEKVCFIMTKKISEYLPFLQDEYKVILFIFNNFLYYLSELNNVVNNFMLYPQKLLEIFLFRFSLFAPIFINKLDDEELCERYEKIPENQTETRFQSLLEVMFGSFRECLLIRNKVFYVINNLKTHENKAKIDYKKLEPDFFKKLRFLCGAVKNDMKVSDYEDRVVFFTDSSGLTKPQGPILEKTPYTEYNKGINLLRNKLVFFSLEVRGSPASIVLLQMFLGHPDFYQNVYQNFNLSHQPN